MNYQQQDWTWPRGEHHRESRKCTHPLHAHSHTISDGNRMIGSVFIQLLGKKLVVLLWYLDGYYVLLFDCEFCVLFVVEERDRQQSVLDRYEVLARTALHPSKHKKNRDMTTTNKLKMIAPSTTPTNITRRTKHKTPKPNQRNRKQPQHHHSNCQCLEQ